MRPVTSVEKTGVGKLTSDDCARVCLDAESATRTQAEASSANRICLCFTRSIGTGTGRRAGRVYQYGRECKSLPVSFPDKKNPGRDCAGPGSFCGLCGRGDSNPHELPHTPLKRARLPVPPLPLGVTC